MSDYDDQIYMNPIIQPPGAVIISEGATLRDAFAMAALTGMLANPMVDPTKIEPADFGACAYDYADAALLARTGLPPITETPDA